MEEIQPSVRSACEAILTKRGPKEPPPLNTPRAPLSVISPPSSNGTPPSFALNHRHTCLLKTEHPARRSSARLRGEKALLSLDPPPNSSKKPKREGKGQSSQEESESEQSGEESEGRSQGGSEKGDSRENGGKQDTAKSEDEQKRQDNLEEAGSSDDDMEG